MKLSIAHLGSKATLRRRLLLIVLALLFTPWASGIFSKGALAHKTCANNSHWHLGSKWSVYKQVKVGPRTSRNYWKFVVFNPLRGSNTTFYEGSVYCTY